MIKINKKNAIILVSGGMDSCVTAAQAINDSYKPYFLHVNYGQLTKKREQKAFNDIANFYNVKEKLIVDISHLTLIGGSCLTDKSIQVPKANINNKEIPNSYVPFRNANILSIAVSWAEIINANAIYIGAVEEDSSGYPDCRQSFFNSFQEVIKFGTKPETKILIKTPLIKLTKSDIINKGMKMNAPLHFTWSCYESEDIPCRQCDSCVLREIGFKKAKIIDPIL
jgi:7-cyano-7-deazaguanine synthase